MAVRVIRVHNFGGPEELRLEDVPVPAPQAGQVRVRMQAIGVNPVDRAIRMGLFGSRTLPFTPGSDGAGDVVAIGDGVERVKVGDRVYVADGPTYAEEIVVPQEAVWPLPQDVPYEAGAAIGIPYVTAYRALHLAAHPQPGDFVLVHGASGGVGTAALQLGRAAGFRMVGTASSEEGRRHVLDQGAEAALPHDDVDGLLAATGGKGFAAIVEMRATQNLDADLRLVANFGEVVVVGASGPTEINPGMLMGKTAALRGISGPTLTPEERFRIHVALGALLKLGVLRPVVSRRYPLAEAGQAQEDLAKGGVLGKIVLSV
jgi:NADPH2:quinone reductase